MSSKLQIIAMKDLTATDDLYLLVDLLNRTLKEKDVVFGLCKSDTPGKMTLTIYRS